MPARKTTRRKKLQGTRRTDRERGIRGLAAEEPSKPDWLPSAVAAIWDDLAPGLVAEGLLTPLDSMSFACLCDALHAERLATDALDKVSREDMKGLVALSRLQRQASTQAMAWLRQFGMTPRSRAQIEPAPPPESDRPELSPARFLSRRPMRRS